MKYFLFDFGASTMRLAVSQTGRRIDDAVEWATPNSYTAAVASVREMVKPWRTERPVVVVGGIAGALDPAHRRLLRSYHQSWVGRPLSRDLATAFGCSVRLENDAALAGLAEARIGGGQGSRIVAFITVSTGIGGARIVDGKIDAAWGNTEPGHHLLNAARAKNRTWSDGAAGQWIAKHYGHPAEALRKPADWKRIEDQIIAGLVNVTAFWAPEVIVLGGPIWQNRHLHRARIITSLHRQLVGFNQPRIRLSILGDIASIEGARLLAIDRR